MRIELDYTDLGTKLDVVLDPEKNPELCRLLWENLPIETIQSHAMASGELMFCTHSIEEWVVPHQELMNKIPVGTVHMNTRGYLTLSVVYGTIYEPEPANPIGRVDPSQLDQLRDVGRKAFECNFLTHFPLRVIIRRKEQ